MQTTASAPPSPWPPYRRRSPCRSRTWSRHHVDPWIRGAALPSPLPQGPDGCLPSSCAIHLRPEWLPPPRHPLRPRRRPGLHPLQGADHAGGRLMVRYAWFVNVRDDQGSTPLHLAARQGRTGCVQVLLENGAIASALTGSYGFPGSTSLHLAARSGSLDCIRKLLAWGADRLQRDSAGRIPYVVAHKRNHGACARLLNPSSTEPMVWPSPLKFISELDPEAKALLEAALKRRLQVILPSRAPRHSAGRRPQSLLQARWGSLLLKISVVGRSWENLFF